MFFTRNILRGQKASSKIGGVMKKGIKKGFFFTSLKITLLTNYLTAVTNVLRLEVGEKMGHDRAGVQGHLSGHNGS